MGEKKEGRKKIERKKFTRALTIILMYYTQSLEIAVFLVMQLKLRTNGLCWC